MKSFRAAVWKQDNWFIAQCIEIDIATQGGSQAEALENIQEALGLHFDLPTEQIAVELGEVDASPLRPPMRDEPSKPAESSMPGEPSMPAEPPMPGEPPPWQDLLVKEIRGNFFHKEISVPAEPPMPGEPPPRQDLLVKEIRGNFFHKEISVAGEPAMPGEPLTSDRPRDPLMPDKSGETSTRPLDDEVDPTPRAERSFREVRFRLEALGFRGITQRPNHAKFIKKEAGGAAVTAILPHYTELSAYVVNSILRQANLHSLEI